MRNIEDLDHFVLAEGETLILRSRVALSDADLHRMRADIERILPGRPVMMLPPEIEVHAGKLEVFGAEVQPGEDSEAAEAARRRQVETAYYDNRVIWAREDGEIFMAHKHNTPLVSFRWDAPGCAYGLTRKDVSD